MYLYFASAYNMWIIWYRFLLIDILYRSHSSSLLITLTHNLNLQAKHFTFVNTGDCSFVLNRVMMFLRLMSFLHAVPVIAHCVGLWFFNFQQKMSTKGLLAPDSIVRDLMRWRWTICVNSRRRHMRPEIRIDLRDSALITADQAAFDRRQRRSTV